MYTSVADKPCLSDIQLLLVSLNHDYRPTVSCTGTKYRYTIDYIYIRTIIEKVLEQVGLVGNQCKNWSTLLAKLFLAAKMK